MSGKEPLLGTLKGERTEVWGLSCSRSLVRRGRNEGGRKKGGVRRLSVRTGVWWSGHRIGESGRGILMLYLVAMENKYVKTA